MQMLPLVQSFAAPLGLGPRQLVLAQVGLAVALAVAAFTCLLPRPRGRRVALGTLFGLAALVVGTFGVASSFNLPIRDYVETVLFWLFGGAALTFGGVLVAQANPARGAIAFAFVILSVCGLFLLLAAPFLMAATIIIYMGAIVVTFLFVLMLSHAKGPSDENDRSREPFLGSFAGFAFAGLVLFTLYLGSPAGAPGAGGPRYALPAAGFDAETRSQLARAAELLTSASVEADPAELERRAREARALLTQVVGPAPGEQAAGPVVTMQDHLRAASSDRRVAHLSERADELRERKKLAFDRLDSALLAAASPDLGAARADLVDLRDRTLLLAGRGEMPANNVAAIGYSLYSEYLLAVELAGTLLLVATIGAVSVAERRGASA